MKFYDALQLDPAGLKQKIREAKEPKERRKMIAAIIVRSVLLVIFSVLVISPVAPIFGEENSAMAVSMLCILLGIRFVDFGYCIKDSMINLAIVFALLLFAPCVAAYVNPFFGAIIHISAFFVIIFMTSDQPEMGNAGLYSFSYIYLAGNPVSGELLWNRAILTIICYLICGSILFAKHRHKNKSVRFLSLVNNFSMKNHKTQWQMELALGVGSVLALGSLFNMERVMWAAFACSSVLGCYCADNEGVKERLSQRMVGTIAGTLIFFVSYLIIPENLRMLFGLMGGLILGFCTDYRYKTASNCLGALLVATGMYGLKQTLILRVVNNFIGLAFGYVFWVLYQKTLKTHFRSKHHDEVESFGI